MPRNLTPEMLAEIESVHTRPRYFLEIELNDDSTVNFWTGEQNIVWNSKTWLSNGYFKDPGQLSESRDGGYEGVSVELTGEPEVLISLLMNDLQRHRPVTIYFGFVSAAGAVIATPVKFTGLLETAVLDDSLSEPKIKLKATSILAIMERSVERRFNQQSHMIDFPDDLGFEYVEQLQDYRDEWGGGKSKQRPKNKAREQKAENKRNRRRRLH